MARYLYLLALLIILMFYLLALSGNIFFVVLFWLITALIGYAIADMFYNDYLERFLAKRHKQRGKKK
jgi:MFS-type transporter involved in bile tolerance (Atg22 family)